MTRFCWRDTTPRTAAGQMALDLAVVKWATLDGTEIVRWYQWSRDTLSLGMHESARRTWSRDRLERDVIAVVRRPTGGRGVWHADTDLTYAWAGPIEGPAAARRRYRELHEGIASVLRANGLAARVSDEATGRPDLSPGACFGLSVGGEILVAGRKAVGAAQRVIAGGLLQHGAIARREHRELEDRYLLAPVGTARSSQDEWPCARDLAIALEQDEIARGAVSAPRELTEALESASVRELATFEDPEWTWRR